MEAFGDAPTSPWLGKWTSEATLNADAGDQSESSGEDLDWMQTAARSLHAFDNSRQDPSPATPDQDYKRVRRKQSALDVRLSPPPALCWTPSPLLLQEPFQPLLPHGPLPSPTTPTIRTPSSRPGTSAPSLVSTATTLQSTPNHTPISRRREPLGCSILDEPTPLNEPLRTKRKFPPLKYARRLPHSGSGSSSGSNASSAYAVHDTGLWEVYAAIFEPPVDVAQLAHVPGTSNLSTYEPTPLDSSSRLATPFHAQKARFVRFEGHEASPSSSSDGSRDQLGDPVTRQEPDLTSSLSLAHFRFPQPPGCEWNPSPSHQPTRQSPPNSATVHYRGTSFDVVNPHTSLLLGAHDFETPAEADGLLDDYFDPRPRLSNMTDDHAASRPSPTSSRDQTESPRPRILYDDAIAARRNILRVQTDSIYPYNASRHEPGPSARQECDIQNLPSNPFSDPPALDGATSVCAEDDKLGAEEMLHRPEHINRSELSKTSSSLALYSQPVTRTAKSTERLTVWSDQFDLSISDDEATQGAHHGEVGSSAQHGVHRIRGHQPVSNPETLETQVHESRAQSDFSEQETEPTMREILNGYDYSRASPLMSHEQAGRAANSAFKDTAYELRVNNAARPATPCDTSRETSQSVSSSAKPTPLHLSSNLLDLPGLPTPPANVYKNHRPLQRFQQSPSDIPTSEQTYGETNQLLQITPYGELTGLLWESRRRNQIPSYYQVPAAPASHGAIQYSPSPYGNNLPALSIASTYRNLISSYAGDEWHPAGIPRMWTETELPRGLQNDGDYHEQSKGGMGRSSSVIRADDDSAWETAASDIESCHPPVPRLSADSYADTSVDGSLLDLATRPPAAISRTPASDIFRPAGNHTSRLPCADQIQTRNAPLSESDVPGLQHNPDMLKAIGMIQRQMTVPVTNEEKATRRTEAIELKKLRRHDSAAVRQAAYHVMQRQTLLEMKKPSDISGKQSPNLKKPPGEVLRQSQPFKRLNVPRSIFDKAASMTASPCRQTLPTRVGASSSPPHGLSSAQSPTSNTSTMRGALGFSDSANTFQTVRHESPVPSTKNSPWGLWTPVQEDWPLGPSPLSTHEFGRFSTHRHLSRTSVRFSGPAVEGQTALQPLRLQSSLPRPRRALTDREMAQNFHTWELAPPSGFYSPVVLDPMYDWRPRIGRLTSNRDRLMIRDHWDGNQESVGAAYKVSEQWAYYTAWCPATSLAFALGGFDTVMARRTGGRCTEMAPEHKRDALVKVFPISLLAYLFVAALVGMISGVVINSRT